MSLPLLLSVPHAGLRVPDEVRDLCLLTPEQIRRDGDEQADEIYLPLRDHVAALVTTDVARAIVDVNRAPDDRRPDGVVKTHTCWNEPVWRRPLSDRTVARLLRRYHQPYHDALRREAAGRVLLGVDCHTMAETGPPIGPDPDQRRPWVCLSHAGFTCPQDWIESLAECFAQVFGDEVAVNRPFRGGYIIRSHATELPWVQLELSRELFLSPSDKREGV
ncbi:MAG: N-formylglutamate amidohydrolase, partial [Planctomycetota bacterium]